jgi:hypothetical protein
MGCSAAVRATFVALRPFSLPLRDAANGRYAAGPHSSSVTTRPSTTHHQKHTT